jgi:hypothetical protein
VENNLNIPDDVKSSIFKYIGGGGDWHANWPLTSPRKLGELGTFSANSFVYSGQSGLDFEVDESIVHQDSWEYLDSDGSSVSMGFDASVPGWSFIGSAKAGIKAEFTRADSVYFSVQGSYEERMTDIAKLRQQLLSVGPNGRFAIGSAVVVERVVADKVLLLVSSSSNSSFKATASGSFVPAAGIKASLAGHLSSVGATAGVNMEQYGSGPVVLAFRAVTLVKTGWLWRKRTSTSGFTSLAEDQQLKIMELSAQPDDWFVKF